MQECDLEEIRFDELTKAIERVFQNVESWEEEIKATKAGKAVITEMLEVSSIDRQKVELSDEFKEMTFSPVTFPKEIIGLLQPGDLFLVTIAKGKRAWKVLYLSPPYWSEPWICDECEQLMNEEDFEIEAKHEIGARNNVLQFPSKLKLN